MMDLKKEIEKTLQEKLLVIHVEVVDTSASHATHPEARKSGGGHFTVKIISDVFEGKTLLERHRLVYDTLKDLGNQIHALKIQALTVGEAKSRKIL